MTDTTVTCPADGCEYTGVRRSVAAHYSGKADDAHSGGWERAQQLLDDQPQQQQPSSSQQQGTPSSESIHDAPDPADRSSSTAQVDLPCGHEAYDPDEFDGAPWGVECSDCGGIWDRRNLESST